MAGRVRWPLRVGLALVGVGAALGIAEQVFKSRDDGAFPHLYVYVADDSLGVRLRPHASQLLRFGSKNNPITHVQIGAEGFRASESAGTLPAPGDHDVLVVGDSQVFGLGVEAEQTFSHVLQEELQKTTPNARVLNLGVPTYGPDEYLATLEHALTTYKPRVMIFAVNMVNDLFEASRPNRDRHAVLDGWAIRKERMPSSTWSFPWREQLLGSSHLIYALRRSGEQGAHPSEGSYSDLVSEGQALLQSDRQARQQFEQGARKHSEEEDAASLELATLDARLDRTLHESLTCTGAASDSWLEQAREYRLPLTTEFRCEVIDVTDKPGTTIETEPGAEESRQVRLTADHLRRAALLRAYIDNNAEAIAEVEKIPAVKKVADLRAAALAKVTALRGGRPVYAPPPLPLSPALDKLAALAKQHDARAVVLVLPIDVAVSKDEWAKYGQPAIDMSSVQAFTAALSAQATLRELEVLDGTPPLAAAEPGAFLDADIHMTPKGHRAIGEGLAALLASPRAVAQAERRDEQMTSATYNYSTDKLVSVSYNYLKQEYMLKHEGCVTARALDSRFTLVCPLTKIISINGTVLAGGGPLEGFSISRDAGAVLAGTVDNYALLHFDAPASDPADVTFVHGNRARAVRFRDKGYSIEINPSQLAPHEGMTAHYTLSRQRSEHAERRGLEATFTACAKERPDDALGPADADCIRTYEGSCRLMLACSRGASYALPRCGLGSVHFGRYGRCFPQCSPTGEASACGPSTQCVTEGSVSACVRPALHKDGAQKPADTRQP